MSQHQPEKLKIISSHLLPIIYTGRYKDNESSHFYSIDNNGYINEFNIISKELYSSMKFPRPNENDIKNKKTYSKRLGENDLISRLIIEDNRLFICYEDGLICIWDQERYNIERLNKENEGDVKSQIKVKGKRNYNVNSYLKSKDDDENVKEKTETIGSYMTNKSKNKNRNLNLNEDHQMKKVDYFHDAKINFDLIDKSRSNEKENKNSINNTNDYKSKKNFKNITNSQNYNEDSNQSINEENSDELEHVSINSIPNKIDSLKQVQSNTFQTLSYFNSYSLKYVLSGHISSILDGCYMKDKSYFISSSSDNTIKIWSLLADSCICLYTFNLNVSFNLLYPYIDNKSKELSMIFFSKTQCYMSINLSKEPITFILKSTNHFNFNSYSKFELKYEVEKIDPKAKQKGKENKKDEKKQKATYDTILMDILVLCGNNTNLVIYDNKNKMEYLNEVIVNNLPRKEILYIRKYDDNYFIFPNDCKAYYTEINFYTSKNKILFFIQVSEDLVSNLFQFENEKIQSQTEQKQQLTGLKNGKTVQNKKVNVVDESSAFNKIIIGDYILSSFDMFSYRVDFNREIQLYNRRERMIEEDEESVKMNVYFQKLRDKKKKRENSAKKRPNSTTKKK